MNDKSLLDIIIQNTYSKTDVLIRLRLLREYLEKRFFAQYTNIKIYDFLKQSGVSDTDIKSICSWGEKFIAQFTRENTYELLGALGKAVDNLPVLDIYLPIEPTDEEKERLGKWFRDHFGAKFILEFHHDEKMEGGCSIIKEGRLHDYSVRAILDKRRDIIEQIITKYAQLD